MKKRTAFILALIMVLCVVLSACGEAKPAKETVTKEALMGGYKTKAEQAKGASYAISMEAKMKISIFGQAQDMEMNSDMKVEATNEAAHLSGTTSTNTGGQKETETMEMYSIKSGEGYDVYTNVDGTWYKSHAEVNVDGNLQAVLSLQDVSAMTMTETDTEYVVEGKVAMADVFNALQTYMGGEDGMDSLGLGSTGLDLAGVEPAKTTYHFDKTSKEATGVDIDMADCMKSLMEQVFKQLAGLGEQIGESAPAIDWSTLMSIDVEKFVVSMKDISMNKEVKIELPEAAKNASEMPIDGPNFYDGLEEYEIEEMSIYLVPGLVEVEAEGYTKALAGEEDVVLILKEEKSLFGNYASNMEEYVQLVVKANESRGITEAVYENGHPTFEYEFTGDGVTYKYYTVLLESDDAYWIVQFACDKDQYDAKKPDYVDWADTVAFYE